jgi:hypothetical protein
MPVKIIKLRKRKSLDYPVLVTVVQVRVRRVVKGLGGMATDEQTR